MPTFKIELMGPVTQFIGKTELNVQGNEGDTLSDIFKEVGKDYGEIVKKKIIAPDGTFHPYILTLVNDTDIRELNGVDTRLKEGDGILVALLIAGG